MAHTAQEDFTQFGFESELIRERHDDRSLLKLAAIWSLGAFFALTIAVVSGYQVIMSDPTTAARFDGIGKTLQAFVPFADDAAPASVALADEDLAKIAPAAGPAD
jgi:hypothetical protein